MKAGCPIPPEFLRKLVALASTMRPSLRKGARAGVSSATSGGNPGFGAHLCQPFCAGYRATGFGYEVIDSFSSKALRRVFFARYKRDLVAATEMPANSASSFKELSLA